MKQSSSYKILAKGPFRHNDVDAIYEPHRWNVQRGIEELERLHEVWERYSASAREAGKTLYNSKIFRLGDLSVLRRGDDKALTLFVGDTDYRQYVATRSSDTVYQQRANPLGTSVLLVTADSYLPIGRRSPNADVNPGKYFTFGGFFDKATDVDSSGRPDIFQCAIREVVEEIGISIAKTDMSCLGVVYDLNHCHPEIVMECPLPHSKSDLIALGSTVPELVNL